MRAVLSFWSLEPSKSPSVSLALDFGQNGKFKFGLLVSGYGGGGGENAPSLVKGKESTNEFCTLITLKRL